MPALAEEARQAVFPVTTGLNRQAQSQKPDQRSVPRNHGAKPAGQFDLMADDACSP